MSPLKPFPLVLLVCAALAGSAAADVLTFDHPNGTIWNQFYTSPYYAQDLSNSSIGALTIFCLDYNDDIGPPFQWQANINSLVPGNIDKFQFGGSYPGSAGPPFAFQGDAAYAGDPYAVAMQPGSDAYHRYLEAAWLFTNILSAQSQSRRDTATMEISQVAAWDLFVNGANIADLRGRIGATGGAWNFTDYVDQPGASPSGLLFRDAVDAALNSAQSAVLGGWTPSIGWSTVTGDPDWVRTSDNGVLVQEFLTPYAATPEPSALVLLGTLVLAGLAAAWFRKRRRIRN